MSGSIDPTTKLKVTISNEAGIETGSNIMGCANRPGASGRQLQVRRRGELVSILTRPPSDYPEELIEKPETRARMSTPQHDELLAQSEILEKENFAVIRICNKTVVRWQQLCY